MNTNSNTTIHLGITMAGAVSAGAYIAGVMDYLFEVLSKYDKLRKARKNLPLPNIKLEVLGGASAGSLCSIISLIGLRDESKKSLLKRCWVDLSLSEKSEYKEVPDLMFKDLLLKGRQGVVANSLLNTNALDKLGRDLKIWANNLQGDLPDYVQDDLEVLFTLTSLKGINLKLYFNDKDKEREVIEEQKKESERMDTPGHMMTVHELVAHFKMNRKEKPEPERGHLIPLNLSKEKNIEDAIELALASGSFPIGLRPRVITQLSKTYLKEFILSKYKKSIDRVDVKLDKDNVELIGVDGGTLNNEPVGEVCEVLRGRTNFKGNQHSKVKMAHLLIDPFPSFEDEGDKSAKPHTILDSLGALFSATLGHARLKTPTEINALNGILNGMIFPSRSRADKFKKQSLACGGLGGFAGFLNKRFREHDYDLGRENCESFLNQYFRIDFQENIGEEWKCYDGYSWQQLVDLGIGYELVGEEGESRKCLPLIPNLLHIQRMQEGKKADVPLYNRELKLVYPLLTLKDIHKFRPNIRNRLLHILNNSVLKKSRNNGDDGYRKMNYFKSIYASGLSIVFLVSIVLAICAWGIGWKIILMFLMLILFSILFAVLFVVELLTIKISNDIVKDLTRREQVRP